METGNMIKRDSTIYTVYGNQPAAMAKQLLNAANAIQDIPAGASVAIKPNLVVSRPAAGGATTHPEIVAGIIEYLLDNGVKTISVIESSWVGDDTKRAFAACGYTDLAKRFGVELFDLKRDSATRVATPAGDIMICDRALAADCLINVPVLKGHCQTRMTCALKNLKGCIPDSEKRRFHREGLDRLIAGLATALNPTLTVVDGICGDLDFEEGGNPVPAERMLLGRDPFRLDVHGCRLMGFEPAEVEYLELFAKWARRSLSAKEGEVKEVNKPGADTPPRQSGKAAKLGRSVQADQACSACYANLIHALKRLEEKGGISRLHELRIGQGWKNKTFDGLGIGVCCKGATRHVPGCPPDASDILAALRES